MTSNLASGKTRFFAVLRGGWQREQASRREHEDAVLLLYTVYHQTYLWRHCIRQCFCRRRTRRRDN